MSSPLDTRPGAGEFRDYYAGYIAKMPEGDLLNILESQIGALLEVLEDVDEATASISPTPGRWTIKQVVGHLVDCERIFANRMHRFASGDLQPLPGIDQDLYVANNDYDTPALADLLDELILLRRANLYLLRRLRPESISHKGTADGHPVTVRALAWMLGGHVTHHLDIVRQRLADAPATA
jgi:hypothetical protein